MYSYSAYKNLCGGIGTCAGYIIFLEDINNYSCPITWSARKIQRVVSSTMAAETLGLVNGVKDSIYIQAI